MTRVVTSLVLSRLDYCNSVLTNLPASTLKPLQPVQNAAARLVLNRCPPISPNHNSPNLGLGLGIGLGNGIGRIGIGRNGVEPLNLSRQSHITLALQQLRWLQVQYRITFKIAVQNTIQQSIQVLHGLR